MTYSARCGVRTDACGLDACSCAPSATQPAIVAQEPVQRVTVCGCPAYDGVGRMGCDVCGHDSTEHEAHDGPCTNAHNPTNTAHNTSREDC